MMDIFKKADDDGSRFLDFSEFEVGGEWFVAG